MSGTISTGSERSEPENSAVLLVETFNSCFLSSTLPFLGRGSEAK